MAWITNWANFIKNTLAVLLVVPAVGIAVTIVMMFFAPDDVKNRLQALSADIFVPVLSAALGTSLLSAVASGILRLVDRDNARAHGETSLSKISLYDW